MLEIGLRRVFPFLLGIGILAFIIAKSYLMQITCDEAYTVLILSKVSIWDLVSYKSSYTNNHILNTLCVKGLFTLFNSDNHTLARVPNIAAFILYFISVFQFSRRYIADNWVSVMFICVMCCNPYLIEFFALTRGYGLSIGIMMGSIYLAARYILDKNTRSLPLSILMGILAVYAQFATLHYYLGLNLMLGIYHLKKLNEKESKKEAIQGIISQIIGAILLTALLYAPLKAIIADNQIAYYGKEGFWQNTLVSIVINSLYAQGYFSNATQDIFKTITLIFLAIVPIYLGVSLWKKNHILPEATHKIYPSVFAVSLFGSVALSPILQFHLLNNQYIIDRTALFFYPLLAMMMPIVSLFFGYFKKGISTFICVLFIVFSINHIIRSNTLSSYREWWYDVHTYEILDFLKGEYEKTDKKQPLKLQTTWMFNPSFQYHHQQKKIDWMVSPPFSSPTDTVNIYDYYYTTRDEMPKLEPKYDKIKEYSGGQWILMKRK